MALPLTITPQVGASLITRVTRLFNGTIHDVLNLCGITSHAFS